jgi:nucleotide-binding universal stress UspA family protein
MRGTIVCAVTDSEGGRDALALAAELSERLGLRLVLAHVASGPILTDVDGDSANAEARAACEHAARTLTRLAAEHGVAGSIEQRSAVGDPAAVLGQIADEEAADVIVVGSRAPGRIRRGLESRFTRQLQTTTLVPVVIAPPRTRRARDSSS